MRIAAYINSNIEASAFSTGVRTHRADDQMQVSISHDPDVSMGAGFHFSRSGCFNGHIYPQSNGISSTVVEYIYFEVAAHAATAVAVATKLRAHTCPRQVYGKALKRQLHSTPIAVSGNAYTGN